MCEKKIFYDKGIEFMTDEEDNTVDFSKLFEEGKVDPMDADKYIVEMGFDEAASQEIFMKIRK